MQRKIAKILRSTDKAFSRQFRRASRRAYKSAIKAGIPVMVASEGALWRVEKQGGTILRTKVKDLPRPIRVDPNVKITIK